MREISYPTELQLNRANSSGTEAPFFGFDLCVSNGTVSTKIHDKQDDFDFDNYRNKALTAKLLRQGYRYFRNFIADTAPC